MFALVITNLSRTFINNRKTVSEEIPPSSVLKALSLETKYSLRDFSMAKKDAFVMQIVVKGDGDEILNGH